MTKQLEFPLLLLCPLKSQHFSSLSWLSVVLHHPGQGLVWKSFEKKSVPDMDLTNIKSHIMWD